MTDPLEDTFVLSANVDPKEFAEFVKRMDEPSIRHFCKREIKENEMCYARGADNEGNEGYIWCEDCQTKYRP